MTLWLLTGSRGEVGSALRRRLLHRGLQVVELELERPRPEAARLVHLAGRLPTAPVHEQIQSNVSFLQEVVCHCECHGVPEIVFASTNSIYAGHPGPSIDEEKVLIDPEVYALTKYLGERLLEHSRIERVLCLRLPGILELRRSTSFMSRLFDRLRSGEPVTLFNADHPFNHFLSIDALHDFLCALRLSRHFDVVNLAAPAERTLFEVASTLKSLLGSSSPIVRRDGGPPPTRMDTTRAERVYGYSPPGVDATLRAWVGERLCAMAGV